jgi:hypothetical protein
MLQKIIIMAAVAGVTTKKNIKGQITHATEDVRKHKDLCLYSMIWASPWCASPRNIRYGKLSQIINLPIHKA